MSNPQLNQAARDFLSEATKHRLMLVTAESCTGGLIAATVCEIPGCSSVFERGFVTYSNAAKREMLGVPPDLIVANGAVSEVVACAMAEGALTHSRADISVAVTGIAGPDGGGAEKPVGLVHFAAARIGRDTLHVEKRFGDIGRRNVQEASVLTAFELLTQLMD